MVRNVIRLYRRAYTGLPREIWMLSGTLFINRFGTMVLPFGNSVAYCVFSMLLITLGEMLWMPLAMGWVAQRSDRGNRSMYMSYCTMTYAVASILAPAFGGAIYQFDRELVWYLRTRVLGSAWWCWPWCWPGHSGCTLCFGPRRPAVALWRTS